MERGLGAYVKRERERRGWTQDQLAVEAGLPDRAPIAQLETRTKLPGADVRRRIAAALGVSHLDLLVAAGELTPDEAGQGTTPTSGYPDVDALCATIRRAADALAADPHAIRVLSDAVKEYERPVVPAAQPLVVTASS